MSEINPIERANIIKREADALLDEVGVMEILTRYGQVTPTGSFFLDTMVYPDIDLYLSKVSISSLFEIGGKLAAHDLTS